jgi:hypothetical protein
MNKMALKLMIVDPFAVDIKRSAFLALDFLS